MISTGGTSFELLGRAVNRAKREMLFRTPAIRQLAQSRYEARRSDYLDKRPVVSPADQKMIHGLTDTGVFITSLDELDLAGTDRVKEQLDLLVSQLAARPPTSNAMRPSRNALLRDPALWQFGLSDRMLDIAENYLGVPVRYYGADVRREVADRRPQHDVQHWHRDTEDYSMLKLLVWLNDVDEDGGPLAYISREQSSEAVGKLNYVSGFISDSKLRRHIPDDEWQLATGPQWTAILADTAQVLHRAEPPYLSDRYSVTFTWTSRDPIDTKPVEPFTRGQANQIRLGLSARQRACLPGGLSTPHQKDMVTSS